MNLLSLRRLASRCLLLLTLLSGAAWATPPTVTLTAPAAGTFREPGTFTLRATASSSGSGIAHVDFIYDGNFGSGSTVNPDGSYGNFWNNIPAGNHVIYAKAYDNNGETANSNSVSITVVPNVAPTVSLIVPADQVTYYAPGTFTVKALANDSDGTVANVQFFYDGSFGSGSNLQPDGSYTFFWNNIPVGTHTIYARATDDSGAGNNSATHTIHVVPNFVNLTSPANNSTFVVPGTFTIRAVAGDGAAIASVSFVYDGQGGNPSTRNPDGSFSAFWNNIPAGTHTLSAQAVDNIGGMLNSPSVTIQVYPSQPPTVAMTNPGNNQIYPPGANIVLKANAADSDGTVSQVQFFNGTTLIGSGILSTGNSANGSYTSNAWTNVPAGTYSITAVATDNTGIAITSSPITVVVDPAAVPTVSMDTPPTGRTAPANIALSATATNAVYGIRSVEFFANGSLIGPGTLSSGTVTSGSYVTNAWNNVAAGTYSITAVAIDEQGGVVTSSPISVTVGAASAGSSSLFFINADHLNTPRVVEDRNGTPVWTWQQAEPFGDSAPNQSTVSGGAFVFNLRFGSVTYYDQETGTLQNTNRDLDPQGGRYVQSDPIGLSGGINTYAYVNGSPLSLIDPDGTITSDRTACVTNPQLCAELFGDMAVNAAVIAAKLNGPSAEACLAIEAANKFKKALRIASWLPTAAGAGKLLLGTAKGAGQLGRDGEAAVRSLYNIGEKAVLNINGRTRIPDGLTKTVLSEVKNVQSQSLTLQLRDYLQYAQSQGLRFDLYTRPSTQLSGPLQNLIDKGFINHLFIPH